MASGIGIYRDLLARPHVARFVFPAVIGQFPYAMISMAVLIGVRDGYGSYTLAGLAGSFTALTTAAFAPLTGRAIDRWGQRRVGVILGTFWLTTQALLGLALIVHPPLWIVLTLAALVGINAPCAGMLRARWRVALKDEPGTMTSALSLTSVIEESMWMAGGPIATLLATLIHPAAALAFGWVNLLVGLSLLLSDRAFEPPAYGAPTRKTAPSAKERMRRDGRTASSIDEAGAGLGGSANGHPGLSAGADARPAVLWTLGFVALMGIQAAYGAFQSSTGIAVVAFAKELNQQEWAGAVNACFAGASMVGAMLYGMRQWTSSLLRRFYVFLGLLALGCSALVVVPNLWAAAAVMFIAGLFQAPTIVNVNQIIVNIVPSSRFTEGMALQGSMWVIGMSAASLVLGVVIDGFGARGGFVGVIGFAVLALALALAALPSLRVALGKRVAEV